MSEDKHADNDPERTLVTLEQLSQTIEVMTSVVNRLRQHLSEQLQAKVAAADEAKADSDIHQPAQEQAVEVNKPEQRKEPFVVEIRQHDEDLPGNNGKTLH